MVPLAVTSVIGGIAGAYLLLHTPAQTFLRVLPWLMLGATLLFMFGAKLARSNEGLSRDISTSALVFASVFELVVSVYGGYFGGGVGILNLAMLAVIGMTDIHAMNALKVVLGGIINGVAVITFIVKGAVVWKQGTIMIVGALVGGYLGGALCAEAARGLDSGVCDCCGDWDDGLFFLEGVRVARLNPAVRGELP